MTHSTRAVPGPRFQKLWRSVLAKRKDPHKLQCIVVQTFADVEGTPRALDEEEEFLKRSYASFQTHIYGPERGPTIDLADDDWHKPVVLRRDLRLERFSSIGPIAEAFFAPWYATLRAKIEAISA